MADANGKSLPQNERIRGHVLQILARQNALSMSLSELGVVLKKATGPFTGKLKSILQHFPADFTVSKKGNVFLLRKEESSEGAIAPPGVTRQLRVGSHEGASTSTPQPHTDISAAAILGEPVMPLNKAKVPVSNRTEPLWLPRDVEVAGPFPSKKVLKLLLKAQKAAAAVGASAEATQMPPISQNGVALQTTQSVSQVPTATQSGVASQTIRPVTAPSDHSKCMITTEDHLSASLDRIAQHSVIALDCEGCNLSRTGRVCLIQVAIPSNPTEVFLFDLVDMSLGARQLVKHGLGTILADPQITKVIHDCRQDSDALYHQLGIRLEGVFDTQAAYVELMKERKAKVRGASGYVPLPGLNKLLKEYAGRENEAKQGGKVLMEQDPLIWEKRPLPPALLQYAIEDVIGLFAVRNGILADCAKAVEGKLALASAEYTGAYRNMRPEAGNSPAHTTETLMVFDETGSLVPVSEAAHSGFPCLEDSVAVEDKLEELLLVLPGGIADDPNLISSGESALLMEVVLDIGRRPVARFLDRRRAFLGPETGRVTQEDLNLAFQKLGAFGSDNRAGIGGTLHRISAMRDRDSGLVLGLTYRVGRAVTGAANPVRDLLKPEVGGNVLVLGPPMTGKTTIIRDMARILSKESWVVIVDTSNEIAGVGAVPHGSVGDAWRMQVKDVESQFATMIECVQNHAPEVIIIDEIGRRREADAARTIAQRGVRLVSSAHGSLASLVSNPFLSELLGGVDLVLVGDAAAQKLYDGRKNVRQRKQDSIFQTVIELSPERLDEWAIFTDVEAKVDKILKGEPFEAEIRYLDRESGQIRIRREMRVPE